MPTGYTRIIEEKEDVTLEEFVQGCATAFFRDMDKLPDKITPSSNYHQSSLKEEKKKLKKVQAMTLEDAEEEAEQEYREERKDYEQTLLETQILKEKYDRMLKQVKAWKPPTRQHYPLKNFMIKQLEESKDEDCSLSWLTEPIKKSGAQYRRDLIKRTKENIKYHTAEWKEEVEEARIATEWIQELKQSLTKN